MDKLDNTLPVVAHQDAISVTLLTEALEQVTTVRRRVENNPNLTDA